MTGRTLTYAAITPARDEAENLPRLAEAMAAQAALPTAWILVDNGSTDATPAIAAELEREHPWVRSIEVPGHATKPGAPVVRSFNAGLAALDAPVDVIVKLDADVSFGPEYFAGLLEAFAADPRLGIASGVCWEHDGDDWHPTYVTGDHVRGATRAYRADCLERIGPLPEEMGWDGVDELKAAVLGWSTRSVADLAFFHHRSVGERDGRRTARWLAEGRCAHYMGYRVPYLLARTVGRAVRDRDLAAFAMPWAFAISAVRRRPRYPDREVLAYLRDQQALRHLPMRLRESFGRRAA
jgi:glycosyltransferase involved in cell wall biosynthesis